MGNLVGYFRLMRPLNLFQGAIAILVCASLMDGFPSWRIILLTIAIVWLYTGGGNSLNDYCDSEIDRINRPTRPIPSAQVSRSGALILSIILFTIGTIFSIPVLNLEVATVLFVSLFFLVTYSTFFKGKPFLGNVIVATILGLTFIFATVIFGDISRGVPPAFLAFGFTLIREIIKDMQDIEGDRSAGANTFPLKYGLDSSKRLVSILTILLITGALLPYILNVYGNFYLLVLIFSVEIPLLFVIFSIQRDCSSRNCSRLSSILKGDIFFGLLAIYLGKF